MSLAWWASWGERWSMAEQELISSWIVRETTKQERWGQEIDGEALAWHAMLEAEIAQLWESAWTCVHLLVLSAVRLPLALLVLF